MINQHTQRTVIFPTTITYTHSMDPNTCVFHISPITKGFGHSIGHCLRRTLLSHCPAISPAAIKIRGVTHEFTTVPGIKEDMLAIKAHLRTLPIAMQEEFEEPIHLKLTLPAEARQLTAKDLPTPHGLTFTDPDHYLLTLTGNTAVDLEVWFICGRASDDPVTIKQKLDFIDFDSETLSIETMFKPVDKVAVNVSPINKGSKRFEALDITITTDSSMSPLDALNHAIQSFFGEVGGAVCQAQFVHKSDSTDGYETLEIDLKQPITILAVNPAIISYLESIGIKTIEELVEIPHSVVKNTPTLTEAVLNSINIALELVDKNLCMKNLN